MSMENLCHIGNAFDVDFRRLYLSVSKLTETYGPIFKIKLYGQNIVVINDVELERKAFGSVKYEDIFNGRPDVFREEIFVLRLQ